MFQSITCNWRVLVDMNTYRFMMLGCVLFSYEHFELLPWWRTYHGEPAAICAVWLLNFVIFLSSFTHLLGYFSSIVELKILLLITELMLLRLFVLWWKASLLAWMVQSWCPWGLTYWRKCWDGNNFYSFVVSMFHSHIWLSFIFFSFSFLEWQWKYLEEHAWLDDNKNFKSWLVWYKYFS